MPSVAKIIRFKASKEYRSGSVSLDRALALVSQAPGAIKSYIGYEIEDPTYVFWVNEWVSKEARDEFAKQPIHKELEAAAHPAFDSEPLAANYVEFEDTKALGAPITEFVTFTLNEGESITELKSLVEKIHQGLAGTPKFHGDSWAPIIGKPSVYHGILGWDTVKAHWDAVSDGPLKVLIDRVKEIANLWLVHAELKSFRDEMEPGAAR